MSFTFRNLFSEEGEGPGSAASAGAPESSRRAESESATGGAEAPPKQEFLVSELLPLIPPAISATSGIPMEKEVQIPMSGDGSQDVRLSTIYQICPELFAAEITPLNDSTVTLPAKIGQPQPAVAGGDSPFGGAGSAFGTKGPLTRSNSPSSSGESASDNPFWSQEADSKAGLEIPGNSGKNSVAHVVAAKSAAKSKSAEQTDPTAGGEAISGGFDSPGMAAESSPESGGEPGAAESNPFAQFTGPSQSGTQSNGGKSGFSENPFESSQGFTTLFSKKPESEPGNPFQQNEADEPAGEDAPDKPAQGFGEMMRGSAGAETIPEPRKESPPDPAGESGLNGAPAAEAPSESGSEGTTSVSKGEAMAKTRDDSATAPVPSNDFPSGFMAPVPDSGGDDEGEDSEERGAESGESRGGEEPTDTERTQPIKGVAPLQPLEKVGGGESSRDAAPEANSKEESAGTPAAESVDEGSVTGKPDAGEEAAEEAPEEAGPAGEEIPAEEVAEGERPAPGEESKGDSEPKSAEVAEKPAAKSPALAASLPAAVSSGNAIVSERDLELRAIFSSDENFTLAKVARRVAGWPGINGCALATPRRIVQASRSEDNRLGEEAKEMISTIRSLAKLTGLPEARTFTLQTDRGTVSLFLEGDCCLTVNHGPGAFGPGVREKLTLIARSMGKLED